MLLIGDVALAHDIGGLLAASRLGLKLTIVLLDNDGGGIFHFLPAAREGDAFVEHIATPHGLDFAHAAALYGCGWERAADVAGVPRRARQARSPPTAPRSSASAPIARPTSSSTGACGNPSERPLSVLRVRTTSKSIGAGDIVEIDKRGRRFHALVTQLEQLESGRFELVVRPLDSRISWRTASVREVVEVWRRARRP